MLDRFFRLPRLEQLAVYSVIANYLGETQAVAAGLDENDRRIDAIRTLESAAAELSVDVGALRARSFNLTEAARLSGWTASRMITLFGSWARARSEAAGTVRLTARQRGMLRAARRGRVRDLEGIRLWLATKPLSRRIVDYDAWRLEFNVALPAGARPVASASMLLKAFACAWPDLLAVAEGTLSLEEAIARKRSTRSAVKRGPHALASMLDVERLLGLHRTAARNASTRPDFPAPAYTQSRPPGIRLWRLRDIQRFAAGEHVTRRARNDLQERYMDRYQVAEALKLAPNTVTSFSSPHLPDPAVALGGFHLWLKTDVEKARIARFAAIERRTARTRL